MAKNYAMAVILVALMMFLAGCANAPAQQPAAQYKCADGSVVADASKCPVACTGSGADYCNGATLRKNSKCVLGTWQYSEEECANGCASGNCKPAEEMCGGITTNYAMPYSEALQIAAASGSACSELGDLAGKNHYCNANSGTWWIEPGIEKNGCTPGCVVFVDNKSAEVNWRCTGALPGASTVPHNLLDCDDKNVCTQDAFEDNRCLNIVLADGTSCGTDLVCMSGACVVKPPVVVQPVPVVPVVPAFVPVPPTDAELKKLLLCGSAFSDEYYRVTYPSTLYMIKAKTIIQANYIQTESEYQDLQFPEYSKVVSSDYRLVNGCACTERQLRIGYKAYGSRSAQDVSSGGTCGVPPLDKIPSFAMLYDNVDAAKIMNVGKESLSLMAYGGEVKKFYQEVRGSDGSTIRETYYLSDINPIPVLINGTSTAADGTVTTFTIELLP